MIKNILSVLRVNQWIKNLFCFVPIIITGNFTNIILLGSSFLIFIVFCFSSSFVYIINDLKDVKYDKKHPVKRHRVIPSGKLNMRIICLILILLLIFIFGLPFFLINKVLYIPLFYILINIIYTFHTKYIPILDVTSIATGFVLRVISGALYNDLAISSWLILLTFTLTLIIGFGKRLAEIKTYSLGETRNVLNNYSFDYIKTTQDLLMGLLLTMYMIYTIDNSLFNGNKDVLFFSIFPVFIGVLRYKLISENKLTNLENPTELIFKDKYIFLSVLFWVLIILSSYLNIYGSSTLFNN